MLTLRFTKWAKKWEFIMQIILGFYLKRKWA